MFLSTRPLQGYQAMDWTCTSGDWVHVLCRIRGWDGHLDDVDGWCLDAWRVWPGGQRKRLDLRVGPLDFAPKFDKNCAVVRLSCWEISGIVCWRKVLDDVWWYRIIILYNYTIIIYDRPSQAAEQNRAWSPVAVLRLRIRSRITRPSGASRSR